MAQSKNHFETLARAGYWAKGIVYLLLGGLALSSVFVGGEGGDSPEQALSTLLGAPMGRVALGAIAVGMAGYVLWRLAQSLLNADGHDNDAMGIITRIGQFISAVGNGAIGLTAANLALTGANSGGGSDQKSMIAMVMSQPFGQWVVGAIGLIVVGAGIGQFYRGITKDYESSVAIPRDKKAMLDPVCQYGLMARGAVFIIIGGLIVYAAITVSVDDAGGVRDALDWLRQQPFGAYLYAAVAAGLAAYGGYTIVQALYRPMNPPDEHDVKKMVPGKN